jgi:hypothetical protein
VPAARVNTLTALVVQTMCRISMPNRKKARTRPRRPRLAVVHSACQSLRLRRGFTIA